MSLIVGGVGLAAAGKWKVIGNAKIDIKIGPTPVSRGGKWLGYLSETMPCCVSDPTNCRCSSDDCATDGRSPHGNGRAVSAVQPLADVFDRLGQGRPSATSAGPEAAEPALGAPRVEAQVQVIAGGPTAGACA